MIKSLLCTLGLFFTLVFSTNLWAMPVYELNHRNSELAITEHLSLLSEQVSLEAVFASQSQLTNWQLNKTQASPALKAGMNWLSFDLFNAQKVNHMYYLTFAQRMKLQKIQVYLQYPNEMPQQVSLSSYQANMSAAALTIEPNTQVKVWLKVQTSGEVPLHMQVLPSQKFLSLVKHKQYIHGFAIGGMLALALMLLFLYGASGSSKVLVLSAYFLARAGLLATILGVNLLWFLPDLKEVLAFKLPLFTAASIIFLAWFTSKLFAMKLNYPKPFLWLKSACWGLLVYMPLSPVLSLSTNLFIVLLLTLFSNLLLMLLGIYLVKQKQRLARVFTILMLLLFLFNLMNIWWNTNGQDLDFYAQNLNVYCVSFWLSGLLMVFLLSREHYYQVKDRDAMQQEALANATASKEAQAALLALQEESQEQLESRVQERTLELNIALQELEAANKELEEKNTRDELTGLFNRRYYDQKIMAEYRRSRRNLTPLSLLILDIDHFKKVNDTLGHKAGDQCIVAIADHIKQALGRSTDIACRYGGEEFCLILPETDQTGAVALAELLRNRIANHPVFIDEKEVNITASIGVSTYQQENEANTEDLFTAADKALYQAKEQGRNQVQTVVIKQILLP